MVRQVLLTHTCLIIVQTISLISSVGAIYFGEVSSAATKDPSNPRAWLFRQIELNWINAPLEEPGDYIGLYLDSEPDENALPVSVHMLDGRTSGQIITDYYLPRIDFYNETNLAISRRKLDDMKRPYVVGIEDPTNNQHTEKLRSLDGDVRWRRYGSDPSVANIDPQAHIKNNILGEECIGYCIAYHSRNRILAKNCLKTSPSWMLDSYPWIASRSLPSLMLPGTHNSATYPHHLDKTVLQIINKYQINQDESVFNQLVYGIRYLDLRVGYSKVKNSPETLWIYHDIFRTDVSLVEVLDQIARFLDLTSHEIVIMDFHRFTVGFQNENIVTQQERHRKVIDLLFHKLDPYIIPSYLGQHAQLSEYIGMGKRLIIGYADRNTILNSLGEQSSLISFFKDPNSKHSSNDMSQDKYKIHLGSSQDDPTNSRSTESTDRRMGTRLFDKLKSLRVIRHSFSKRSIVVPNPSNDTEKYMKLRLESSEDLPRREELKQTHTPRSFTSRLSILFSSVRHVWPNKDTIEGLAQFMNETACRKYFDELRSLMVELTPTVFGAIADKYDGNRKLAQQVNRPVTDWIRDKWLHCLNIVASDFFLGNDLTRLAISSNKVRASNGRLNLNDHQSCKSFRKLEGLLDRSKIPIQFTYQLPPTRGIERSFRGNIGGGNNIIAHVDSNGDRIFLKPVTQSHHVHHHKPQPRELKESMMDSLSDGITDLFNSFKKLLSL